MHIRAADCSVWLAHNEGMTIPLEPVTAADIVDEEEGLTMQMEPPTASAMPMNFWREPASRLSSTAIMAVKTGMVGCMQVATTTPDMSMPTM